MKKVLIQIFGIEDEIIDRCESCAKGCSNCSGCISHNCSNIIKGSTEKNMWQSYEDTVRFIKNSDISENTVMEFIDIKRDGLENYKNIEKLLFEGYSIPLTVIDGIVRYYGGISKELIYKDAKEVIE